MIQPDDETLKALEESLRHSPRNVPLLRHMGDVLRRGGRVRDAERRYRQALRVVPDDDDLRLSLANCYLLRGRHSHAGVLLDLLVQRPQPLPATFLLQARIRMHEGDVRGASSSFRRAIEGDPSLMDTEFATRLGFAQARTREAEEEEEEEEDEEEYEEEYEDPLRQTVGPENHGTNIELETLTSGFADVGGMQAIKSELSIKTVGPIQHPELFAAYGKAVGGSVFMFGPRGCGKATVSRAVAGEAHMGFIGVASHSVLEMWLGQSERNLHSVFQMARECRPCVLYFQEIDILLEPGAAAAQRLHHQFLTELSGSVDCNEGVLIVAATEAPWAVDPALVAGFDQRLFVDAPDADERAAILEILMRGKPFESVDPAAIAARTVGFSAADLKRMLGLATEIRLREALDSGRPQPITGDDLFTAAAAMSGSVPGWFSEAHEQVSSEHPGFWVSDVVRPESA